MRDLQKPPILWVSEKQQTAKVSCTYRPILESLNYHSFRGYFSLHSTSCNATRMAATYLQSFSTSSSPPPPPPTEMGRGKQKWRGGGEREAKEKSETKRRLEFRKRNFRKLSRRIAARTITWKMKDARCKREIRTYKTKWMNEWKIQIHAIMIIVGGPKISFDYRKHSPFLFLLFVCCCCFFFLLKKYMQVLFKTKIIMQSPTPDQWRGNLRNIYFFL